MIDDTSKLLGKRETVPGSGVQGHRKALEASAWLAAVVENSDDAIISKTLDGIITTWNRGAERLFGYTAHEAIGQPIRMIIPDDRLFEEDEILRRLRNGERVDHFETVRLRKNGELVEISVTISPVRAEDGSILGASKIARDITDQKRASAQQALLLREMHHRIKNLFTLTAGLVTLSAKASAESAVFVADFRSRLQALARAHALTMPDDNAANTEPATTFVELLQAILAPHVADDRPRIAIRGCDAPLVGKALTSIALLLHELATNAAKYGALSGSGGRLSIDLSVENGTLRMIWQESNAPHSSPETRREGFGTTLEQAAVSGVQGSLHRDWKADGVSITLEVALRSLVG